MKKNIRSVAKAWHVWLGLSLGLLFCLMGLSGSLILSAMQSKPRSVPNGWR